MPGNCRPTGRPLPGGRITVLFVCLVLSIVLEVWIKYVKFSSRLLVPGDWPCGTLESKEGLLTGHRINFYVDQFSVFLVIQRAQCKLFSLETHHLNWLGATSLPSNISVPVWPICWKLYIINKFPHSKNLAFIWTKFSHPDRLRQHAYQKCRREEVTLSCKNPEDQKVTLTITTYTKQFHSYLKSPLSPLCAAV